MVYSETAEDKEEWLKIIRDTVDEYKRGTLSLKLEDTQKIEAEAPIWQPDSTANNCTICNCEFSLLNRRHHCRMCGKLVCGNCSPHRVVLPNIDTSKQRICVQCFEAINEKQKQEQEQQQQEQQQEQQQQEQQLKST